MTKQRTELAIKEYLAALKSQFNDCMRFVEKRPGIRAEPEYTNKLNLQEKDLMQDLLTSKVRVTT